MFGEEHRGHTFERLDTVYQEAVTRVTGAAARLEGRISEITREVDAVEAQTRQLRATKDECMAQIRAELSEMEERLEAEFSLRLTRLLGASSVGLRGVLGRRHVRRAQGLVGAGCA